MAEIPDSLHSVFNASVREQNGSYVIEIPSNEIEHETITVDNTYRIAIFESGTSSAPSDRDDRDTSPHNHSQTPSGRDSSEPPVDEGEVREVTIETIGDQGDGIAKVERGYVVIVPDAQPGHQPTIKIEQVRDNVAFATVIEDDPRAL